MMPRFLACVVVVSMFTCITHAQNIPPDAENIQIIEKPQNNSSPGIKVYEEMFKKSFGYERNEHMKLIKRLQKMDKYERLYTMITILGDKIIDAIETNRAMIKNGHFNSDTNKLLPQDVAVQTAISSILEYTALFSDILLHFPHIVHRIINTKENWRPTIDWSLNFTNQMKYILDVETLERIRLAFQELNISERTPEYHNPYWQPVESQKVKEITKKKKSAKKTKERRGPQATKFEL